MRKYILQFIYCFVLRNFLKIIVGVKFGSNQFLKDLDHFVILANHNSHLDTMAIMAAMPANIIHKVKPVAAKDYFGKTKTQAAMSNYFINTLLINREGKNNNQEQNPIRQMIAEIEMGNSLIVFPEGSRGEPEKMQTLKKGITLVLRECPTVHYIPMFLYGMGKAMPKGDNVILPYTSSITFGQPQMIDMSLSKDELINKIEQEILALRDGVLMENKK